MGLYTITCPGCGTERMWLSGNLNQLCSVCNPQTYSTCPPKSADKKSVHDKFRTAWENYPSQDNEGYVPDRGGFKCGYLMGHAEGRAEAIAEIRRLSHPLNEKAIVIEIADLEALGK